MRLPPLALAATASLLSLAGCEHTTAARHARAVASAEQACDGGSPSACVRLQAFHADKLNRDSEIWTMYWRIATGF